MTNNIDSAGIETSPLYSAKVNYGDGTGDQDLTLNGQNFELNHQYMQDGTFDVTVTIIDNKDGSEAGKSSITVPINNKPPEIDTFSFAAINEGSTLTQTITFKDPGNDTWSATINYGDGTSPVTISGLTLRHFDINHTYSKYGTYTVTITVSDGTAADTKSASITVNNVAPVVDAGGDVTIDERVPFTRTGSFTDPGTDIWTATVNYGDGSDVQPLTLTGKNFTLNHTYNSHGTYTVTVTVTDSKLDSGTATFTVTVNHVALTVTLTPTVTLPIFEGDTFTGTGSFS